MNTFLKENFFKLLIGSSILILSIGVLIYIVTATQTPPSANDKIIGEPIKIGNLEVAQFDIPKYMNRNDASSACKALGSGWRLPNRNELHLLHKNKDKIGGFSPEWYVSRSVIWKDESQLACFIDFETGRVVYMRGIYDANVRAVRTF